MRYEVKCFIERNILLIEEHEFEELYKRALKELPFQIGNLTTSLMDAGINPLDYSNKIYSWMFSNSMIKQLDIPNQITEIESSAFRDCFWLTKVHIPLSIIAINEYAFSGCYDIEDITYEGTITEWKDVDKNGSIFYDCYTDVVHCSDGDFRITNS